MSSWFYRSAKVTDQLRDTLLRDATSWGREPCLYAIRVSGDHCPAGPGAGAVLVVG